MNFLRYFIFACWCLFANNTFACCDCNHTITLQQIDNSYKYIKHLRLDSHNKKKNVYFTLVLSAGTSYQFAYHSKRIYINDAEDYDVEIRYYNHKAIHTGRSKKFKYESAKDIVHQFVIGGRKNKGSSFFHCTKTGIYILKVPSAQGICACIALAYFKENHWNINIDVPEEKNKDLKLSWVDFSLNLKEDEEGYILIKVKDNESGINWKYRYYIHGKSRKKIVNEIEQGIFEQYGVYVTVQAHYFKK